MLTLHASLSCRELLAVPQFTGFLIKYMRMLFFLGCLQTFVPSTDLDGAQMNCCRARTWLELVYLKTKINMGSICRTME